MPHLNTLEAVQQELKEAKEAAKSREKELRAEISQLRYTNLEYSK